MQRVDIIGYRKVICWKCCGKGCSVCNKKGFLQLPIHQIEGVQYEKEAKDLKIRDG